MQKIENVYRFFVKAAVWFLGLLVGLALLYTVALIVFQAVTWKSETSPLPEQTIAYLCVTFHEAQDETVCSTEEDAYAREFYSHVRDHILAERNEVATRDDVTGLIGQYETSCSKLSSSSLANYECRYDFRGDNRFRLVVVYSEDGQVVDVQASSRIAGSSD